MAKAQPRRRSMREWSVGILLVLVLLEVACTTSNPVMTFLFEGVPQPGEVRVAADVVKQPRRPAYKPPPPLVKWVEIPDLPPPTDWEGIFKSLPRTDSGAAAWVKALDEKLITPKPGLADDAKDEDPSEIDVEMATSGKPENLVLFQHKPHTQWLACPACHSGLFEMEKGKAKITMADHVEGQYCGVCHASVASPELSSCPECHKAMK